MRSATTRYIGKLVEYPEALQVREFANGLACLVAVRAVAGAPMVRHSIAELRETVPGADMRIVGIYRRLETEPDRFIICEGPTLIKPGDEVFVLSAREHLQAVLSALHCYDKADHREVERIMIAGGGRVGLRLARQLVETWRNYQIKVLERNGSILLTIWDENRAVGDHHDASAEVLHAGGRVFTHAMT